MRLLFALELPPSMIETLTELQRRLLGIGIGGRAISQENFRMLFQVGGEVSEDDAQALIHKLETDWCAAAGTTCMRSWVGIRRCCID